MHVVVFLSRMAVKPLLNSSASPTARLGAYNNIHLSPDLRRVLLRFDFVLACFCLTVILGARYRKIFDESSSTKAHSFPFNG